ncbi:hypothetical protein GLOIN_2v1785728 [Rhizophagus irregularis DAOM 181602=DAOM 197198]|nr:hypothetical protein GLOIN_2v1785728 [Rhizophagus irregularis DAOM 181602=DAOM 197198]
MPNKKNSGKNTRMEADVFEDVDTSSYEKSFKKKYNKMNDDLKWKLQCTGRVVEDVLFNSISNFTSEHLVHSFTIDINDSMLKEPSCKNIIIRLFNMAIRTTYDDMQILMLFDGIIKFCKFRIKK